MCKGKTVVSGCGTAQLQALFFLKIFLNLIVIAFLS